MRNAVHCCCFYNGSLGRIFPGREIEEAAAAPVTADGQTIRTAQAQFIFQH